MKGLKIALVGKMRSGKDTAGNYLIEKFKAKNLDDDTITLKKLQKEFEEAHTELSALNKEVAKSILGKSQFKTHSYMERGF